ncbi:hypothetical protein BDP27DRAFT_1365777 [Rhodocollybia butyracea]|uniref:C2H2-type domain-containing protein n=1 Tax=Rhodocollybia butyracea TaxID=206335 RepID=A0A9P5U408_9AGAR|nr:hypothetical protein BDP27DRAFT_1365777 [Rhodocollybia butyracea]
MTTLPPIHDVLAIPLVVPQPNVVRSDGGQKFTKVPVCSVNQLTLSPPTSNGKGNRHAKHLVARMEKIATHGSVYFFSVVQKETTNSMAFLKQVPSSGGALFDRSTLNMNSDYSQSHKSAEEIASYNKSRIQATSKVIPVGTLHQQLRLRTNSTSTSRTIAQSLNHRLLRLLVRVLASTQIVKRHSFVHYGARSSTPLRENVETSHLKLLQSLILPPNFECPDCHKQFTREGSYRNHIRTHLSLQKFWCGVCGQGFTDLVGKSLSTYRSPPYRK